jgi:N-acyl-L-homoserine lactone synthetase
MAFQIKRAETASEREELYRIRHRIFIEEMKYGELEPDGRMRDRFDELPGTSNFVAVVGRRIVAGVRLVEPRGEGTPADAFYDFSAHIPAGSRMCAGSMLFVDKAFREQRAMMHALMGCFYTWVMLRGFTHILGVAAPVAERFFFSEGYRPLCPRFFHEELKLFATPVMMDISELAPGLRQFALRHQVGGTDVFERRFFAAGEEVPLLDTDGELFIVKGQLRLEQPGSPVAPIEFGEGEAFNAGALAAASAMGARLVAQADAELALVSRRVPSQARLELAATG